MDFDDDEEKKVAKSPKFPIQMYISEGNQYFRLGKYDLAIDIFNKGLEKEPANEKCLIGRSKCYMGLAKYDEAKRDAETVANSNPKSYDAKMLIGEADYFLGDFEKAFLTFYRGYKTRTNHGGLRCGHQMCRKAIDNALKPDVPIVFDDVDLKNLFELKEDMGVDQTSSAGQDQYSAHFDFVNSLLQDESFESIHQDCIFLKDYLKDRQVFWNTQNPKTSKSGRNGSTSKSLEDKVAINVQDCSLNDADETVSTSESHSKTLANSIAGYRVKTNEESLEDDSHMCDLKEKDYEISSSNTKPDILETIDIHETVKNEDDKAKDDIHMSDSDDEFNLRANLKNNTDSNSNTTKEKIEDCSYISDSDETDNEISANESRINTPERRKHG